MRKRHVLKVAALALAGAACATAALVMCLPTTEPTATAEPAPAVIGKSDPTTLEELLAIEPSQLANVDIARANLICAMGLPGCSITTAAELNAELAKLDRWAAHVASETARNFHRFTENPGEYNNSEAYFRALMLVVVLQEDFKVRYNTARINAPDFTDSRDLFIHGMTTLGGAGGTCVSMPILYAAVGRRLGYPIRIALAKGHVFARWDAPPTPEACAAHGTEPRFAGRFNLEGTNRGFTAHEDSHYAKWPNKLTPQELAGGWYLHSLTGLEEMSQFLLQRGHCLHDTGNGLEARTGYAAAATLAPRCPEAVACAKLAPRAGPHGLGRPSPEAAGADPRQNAAAKRPRPAAQDFERRAQKRIIPAPPVAPAGTAPLR